MVVADRSGVVHIIDKNLKVESFLAYESGRITHMKQLRQRNILVTVGVRTTLPQFFFVDRICLMSATLTKDPLFYVGGGQCRPSHQAMGS